MSSIGTSSAISLPFGAPVRVKARPVISKISDPHFPRGRISGGAKAWQDVQNWRASASPLTGSGRFGCRRAPSLPVASKDAAAHTTRNAARPPSRSITRRCYPSGGADRGDRFAVALGRASLVAGALALHVSSLHARAAACRSPGRESQPGAVTGRGRLLRPDRFRAGEGERHRLRHELGPLGAPPPAGDDGGGDRALRLRQRRQARRLPDERREDDRARQDRARLLESPLPQPRRLEIRGRDREGGPQRPRLRQRRRGR